MTWVLALGYVHELAWPLVIVFAVILFRTPLASALDRITEFSWFGFKAKMGKEVEKVQQKVERNPDAVEAISMSVYSDVVQTGPKRPKVSQKTQNDIPFGLSSERQVVLSWRELEMTLGRISSKLKISIGPTLNITQILNELKSRHLISDETKDIIDDLRRIKNELQHRSQVEFLTDSATDSLLMSIKKTNDILENIELGLSVP